MPNVTKGNGLQKLLWYLWGPGYHNEHSDPHVVAGYEPPSVMEPPRSGDGRVDVRPLAADLAAPITAVRESGRRRMPKETVWHCSLSLSADEGRLSDEEWRGVAGAFVREMGFEECRWVAVRHGVSTGGNDHIHIVTTRFTEDGRLVSWHKDFPRAQDTARVLEERFGLAQVAVRDGVLREDVTQAEFAIARKNRRPPDRLLLRKEVLAAVAVSRSELDVVARLREKGLLVRVRTSVADPSEVTGWAVAVPPENDEEPTWFGGGRLGDFSLPTLRARWPGAPAASAEEWARALAEGTADSVADSDSGAGPQPVSPSAASGAAWSEAAVWAATAARTAGGLDADPADIRVVGAAAVDLVAQVAVIAEPHTIGPVSRAADALSRAAVAPRGAGPTGGGSAGASGVARALRSAASRVAAAGRPVDRDGLMAVLAVIAAVAQVAEALARLHEATRRHAAAGAAVTAYTRLGSVVQDAADRGITPPAPVVRQRPAPARPGRPETGRDLGEQVPRQGRPGGPAGHDGPDRPGGDRGG